jgi:radical SAM protein with 4Fe4S-binding SPASM domain
LFRSIIDQIKAECTVTGWFAIGLFGDSLLDPDIVERARYIKAAFPGVLLSFNTNCAAYSPDKHAVLAGIVDAINIHIESMRPGVYGTIMRPLRFERVWPKVEAIIRDFGSKITAGIPLHRLNVDELEEMTDYYLAQGVGDVEVAPLSNRCSSNLLFDQLAFKPIHPQCRSGKFDDLIIDWDGSVVACCNDFRRSDPIGNLATTPLRQVLDGRPRREFARKLDAGEWATIGTCSSCLWDKCEAVGRVERPPAAAPPVVQRVRAEAELAAVYASTSWRITAPLRAIGRLASRR